MNFLHCVYKENQANSKQKNIIQGQWIYRSNRQTKQRPWNNKNNTYKEIKVNWKLVFAYENIC